MLLVARRRGHVPDPTNDPRSITQMEYAYARKHKIDVLPFLLSDDEDQWPGKDERATVPLMKPWRETLLAGYGVGFFTRGPASIERQLHAAIARWLQRRSEQNHLHAYLRQVEEEFGVLRIPSVPNYRDEDNRNIGNYRRWSPMIQSDGFAPDIIY